MGKGKHKDSQDDTNTAAASADDAPVPTPHDGDPGNVESKQAGAEEPAAEGGGAYDPSCPPLRSPSPA
eukprot:15476074-Alexandrium_andersonii.AAC.1